MITGLSLNKIATALEIIIIINPIISTEQNVKTNLLSLFFERKNNKIRDGIVKVIAEDIPLLNPIDINFIYAKKEKIIKVNIEIKTTFFEYFISFKIKKIIAR
ncbi:hypothetical protein JYG23_09235 [Sedimentibacter sp. zth1]|uniref:hypothetical protein n=1 Tax=Sedimentibacter sp. zth1 TaxID=2816908 RepID=UPI001A92D4A9|nr:hypothetical protein [Sedimentibacter sp. zth1]QSX04883.1 hypothetical protein JYG23_09235 [Sedimentibacter sp. zth1]